VRTQRSSDSPHNQSHFDPIRKTSLPDQGKDVLSRFNQLSLALLTELTKGCAATEVTIRKLFSAGGERSPINNAVSVILIIKKQSKNPTTCLILIIGAVNHAQTAASDARKDQIPSPQARLEDEAHSLLVPVAGAVSRIDRGADS